MRPIGAHRSGHDDGQRGSDAELHADLFWYAEQAEHLEQHRNYDGAAANAEQTGEQTRNNSSSDNRDRKPGQLAERYRGHGSRAAILAQQRRQLGNAGPLLAAIDRLLDLRCTFSSQKNPRELMEFRADLGFGKRLLEVAAVALARLRILAAVDQDDGHTGRPQAR